MAITQGLGLVERLIRLEIGRLRASGVPAGQDEYRGLYISDEEVDQLLGAPAPNRQADLEAESEAQLAETRLDLEQLAHAVSGPLGSIIRLGALNTFETGCLLLGLALEADTRFERLFAYVQDDVTKRRPRVELALRLLAPAEQRLSARTSLSAPAPLRRLRLITLHGEAGQPYTPLPAHVIALDARVAAYLLGQSVVDEALRSHAELLAPGDADIGLPDSLVTRLTAPCR